MTSTARRFELVEGTSSKFWEVQTEEQALTVRFGKIGTAGTVQTKSFASAAECAKEAEKLAREKTKKGYIETANANADVNANAAVEASPPGVTSIADIYRAILDITAMTDPNVEVPPPATAEQLAAVEAALGFPLPAALRAMLEVSNGATVALFADEGSVMSTSEMIEQIAFCNSAVQHADDQKLVPFARNSDTFAFYVDTPGHKRRGVIGHWNPDGESFGDLYKPLARSVEELLTKRHAKLQRQLPKGMPIVTGFAFGALPSRETLDQMIAALKTAKGAIDHKLNVFAGNRPMLRALVEGVLEGGNFLAYEVHDEILASLADEIDLDVVLRAFRKRTLKERRAFVGRYFDGWTIHLDNLMTTLIARDAARVEAASKSFAPTIADGYTLVRRRLGQLPLDAIPTELRKKIAVQASTPPNTLRIIENGATRDIERPQDVIWFDFALAPFFTDMNEHARYLLEFILGLEGMTIPSWMAGPPLRVATVTEAATVMAMVHDLMLPAVLEAIYVAQRPMATFMAEVARALPRTMTLRASQAVGWSAYVAASDEGQRLPDLDDAVAGFEHVVDASIFSSRYSAVLRKLGPERVARIFSRHPGVIAHVAALS